MSLGERMVEVYKECDLDNLIVHISRTQEIADLISGRVDVAIDNICKNYTDPDFQRDVRDNPYGLHNMRESVDDALCLGYLSSLESIDDGSNVYVVDIGTGSGMNGLVNFLTYSSRLNLSMDGVDIAFKVEAFEATREYLGIPGDSDIRFLYSEARDFLRSDDYAERSRNRDKVIWICRYPEEFTNDLCEFIGSLDFLAIPDEILIMQCDCHSYMGCEFCPSFIGDEGIMRSREWNSIGQWAVSLRRARNFMDALRVFDLMSKNVHIEAKVLSMDQASNIIKITRKVS